jgi:hypothetical protein
MKRSLVLVPIVLLIVLNACGANASQDQINTAVAQSMTALSWTPTLPPSPTLIPNRQWLADSLNGVGSDYAGSGYWENRGGLISDTGLAVNLDELEDSIGADFVITDVQFPALADKVSVAFQISARCECASTSSCCTPEHMFILTIRRLYLAIQQNQPYQVYQDSYYINKGQVPTPVQELWVECYDHQNKMARMVAPWSAVLSFMHGEINGRQLGQQVHKQY